MLANENMGEATPSSKFNAFVRKSVERASSAASALKFVPLDKKENTQNEEDVVVSEKKEHRRAQVRKAQIEHRQRKETHIKTLEQEISDLRDMIESVENQSHLFHLENTDIKKLLQKKESVNRLNVPVRQPAPHSSHATHIRTPHSDNSEVLLEDQKFVDAIASVDFDHLLNISYLQLKSVNDFGFAASSPHSEVSAEARELDPNRMMGRLGVKRERVVFDRSDERRNAQMGPEYDDPALASLAINFILTLEHPCRTHFLPRGLGPTPGLPVLPAHVASGHELMASTYLYSQAPLPVFQTMHWTSTHPPTALTSTPWRIPSTPQEELKKLWLMSTSLSKHDWEITPVQAWFLLVESLGTEVLRRREVCEELKGRLGGLVECFGFGASLNEGLFWGVVGDVERICGGGG